MFSFFSSNQISEIALTESLCRGADNNTMMMDRVRCITRGVYVNAVALRSFADSRDPEIRREFFYEAASREVRVTRFGRRV